MTRVVAVSSVLGEPVTSPARAQGARARFRRGELARLRARRAPSVQAIQDAVCSVLGVPRADLLSARRTARVSRARQLAMYLTRELTTLSLAQIAREFDRDHTTVLHAVRTVSKRLEPGSETAEAVHKRAANPADNRRRRPSAPTTPSTIRPTIHHS